MHRDSFSTTVYLMQCKLQCQLAGILKQKSLTKGGNTLLFQRVCALDRGVCPVDIGL